MSLSANLVRKFINFWPPFLGAGIRVQHMSTDFRKATVSMGLHFWNKNYAKVQYGGSLFSMTDAFLMVMLSHNLGADYIVWDKSATIRYLKPGRSRVFVNFEVTQAMIDDINHQLQKHYKVEPLIQLHIKDEHGNIIAEVDKVLHIRKKGKQRADL